MKYILLKFLILFGSFTLKAQVISQFDWDSNPPTSATVGPDAISISGSATVGTPSSTGANGLSARAPGTSKADLDMVLPNDPIFNVDGIRITFDYQREESVGNFVKRGSGFRIKGSNNLSVTYQVDDGSGGVTTISSGNVYSIPNDDTYRTYQFSYDPDFGIGRLLVDGVEVWSNDGPDNRNMVWDNTNIVIGDGLDGSGSQKAFLDNLIIENFSNTILPIKLEYFSAEVNNCEISFEWRSASEINAETYEIEYSLTGLEFNSIRIIDAQANNGSGAYYSYESDFMLPGFYRLKMNSDVVEYSDIVAIHESPCEHAKLFIHKNPIIKGNDIVISYTSFVGGIKLSIIDSFGVIQKEIEVDSADSGILHINVGNLKSGVFYINAQNSNGEISIVESIVVQ